MDFNYSQVNKRTGKLVRAFYVDNTRLNHYEIWNGNRTFIVYIKAEAYRLYNQALV